MALFRVMWKEQREGVLLLCRHGSVRSFECHVFFLSVYNFKKVLKSQVMSRTGRRVMACDSPMMDCGTRGHTGGLVIRQAPLLTMHRPLLLPPPPTPRSSMWRPRFPVSSPLLFTRSLAMGQKAVWGLLIPHRLH